MPQDMSRQNRGGNPPRPMQGGEGGRPNREASIDVSKIVFGEKIDPKLYSDIAEAAAKAVAGDGRGQRNKPSQLRRFYDELIVLQEKVGSDSERFELQLPFIQMLKAKVAYAKGREKVDENFVRLFRQVVDQAQDVAKLRQARFFMEAFMAFYKQHGPRD